MSGAHDILVDVKAQGDIIIRHDFVPFINRKESIQTMSNIFAKNDECAEGLEEEDGDDPGSPRPMHEADEGLPNQVATQARTIATRQRREVRKQDHH